MIDDIASKVEFAVKIKSPECIKEVKENLIKIGINDNDIVESIVDSSNTEFRCVIKTSKVRDFIDSI
jgi:DNA-directed RNA polymerase subunit F